jgi:hypothetical protein
MDTICLGAGLLVVGGFCIGYGVGRLQGFIAGQASEFNRWKYKGFRKD